MIVWSRWRGGHSQHHSDSFSEMSFLTRVQDSKLLPALYPQDLGVPRALEEFPCEYQTVILGACHMINCMLRVLCHITEKVSLEFILHMAEVKLSKDPHSSGGTVKL